MISFGPTEEQDLIRETVQEFAASEMLDISRDADGAAAIPDGFLEKTWELGLVSGSIPEEYGGGGMERSPVTSVLILEELAHGCASLGAAAMAPGLFVNALLDYGTQEQKNEYLPLFCTTDVAAGSIALQEQTFAFDPAKLTTIAEPKGDGFNITGVKRLVPLGDRASHFLVVARAGAGEGMDAVDAFIVPRDASGLTIGEEAEKKLGLHALTCSALDLKGVEVPASARLGGDAGIDAQRLVNSCRVASLAIALGLSRAMMEISIPYAKDRIAFGKPIAQKQAIAFKLAEMQIEVNTMRWMIWKAASYLEKGLDATAPTALARAYVNREAMKIADDGVQVFGGHGYIRDYPVEMWYRNARTVTVLDAVASV
jgi:alkylation response protein AidB-like acyl-CoA dehydrogenase